MTLGFLLCGVTDGQICQFINSSSQVSFKSRDFGNIRNLVIGLSNNNFCFQLLVNGDPFACLLNRMADVLTEPNKSELSPFERSNSNEHT